MTKLDEELENLSEEQRELFEMLLEKEGIDFSQLPITRRSCKGPAPLSYAQYGLWLAAKTTSRSPFNHPLVFRIHGPLNLTALEQALNEMLNRHEILRTVCSVADREPVQIVNAPGRLTIPIIDLQKLHNEQKETEALRLAVEEARQPFDLEKGPLLRTKLIHLDDREYIFILTTHTFIADGFSLGILLRELGKLYDAFSQGKPSPLHELPIQFADFAVWQRQIINGEFFKNQLDYWKQQLKGSPAILKWPIDHVSTSIQSFRGETKYFSLPCELSESLRALARKEGVTLFMVLLTSLKILLYRLTRQEDIVVSTMVSNRNRSELEALIGYFANNLLLWSKVSPEATFCQLLKKVSETAIDSFANQDYPFEKVFEDLASDQETARVPIIQVMFVLHDHSTEEDLKFSELTVENYPIEKGTAIFDFYFRITDLKDKLSGSVEYSTDLFDSATIDQILKHFQSLLQCIAANPQQKVSEMNFLSDAELNQLVEEWNKNQTKEINKSSELHFSQSTFPVTLPETELEKKIASVWIQVLQIQDIGLHDNFFDLGSRSLHIIEVHSRLKKLIKKEFSALSLFEYPTVSSLAKHLALLNAN